MIIFNKIRRCLFRSKGKNIDYNIAKQILNNVNNAILIDVRTKDEYNEKHLKGAINIPLQDIQDKFEKTIPNKNTTIIVYCQMGGRSLKAANKLEKMGYKDIYNIEGGIEGIR